MPGRILVVDNQPSDRSLLRAHLARAYYDVIEAGSGVEAMSAAIREEPDLIVLHAAMPGIDGFHTCRRLKSMPETAHIPVIMLSGLRSQEERMRGLDAGADDFLTTPFDDAALLSRVSGLTRMKMMVDELRLRAATARGLGIDPGIALDGALSFADATVLIVMADADLARSTGTELRRALGCATETAAGLAEAQSLIASNGFDAFIIGAGLADGDPLRLAAHLRARPETRQAAVVMLFAAGDHERPSRALEFGVTDHLVLPPDHAEIAARLRVQLRRKHYSDQLRKSVHDSMVQAVTDPLTGLYNRRYSNAHVESMIARSKTEANGLAAMVLDLDRFKAVNDLNGHAAGDAVLVEFARRLSASLRNVDLIARIGGEEFLAVMPDIRPEHARRVAERVRHSVETPPFRLEDGTELHLTVSIGLALHRPGETSADLIARADAAVYASKASGRNMVTLAAA